ncbi:MAG: TRAP transporter small permease [Balneolaceae bacterium]
MSARLNILDRLLSNVVILLMGSLVLVVTWQVATRYLLGSPSSVTEEIARFLLIWIGLLGSAYAYRQKKHLAFDYLLRKQTHSIQRRLEMGIHSVIALFSVIVLVVGGGRLVQLSLELGQHSAALQIPLGVVYLVLPLSGIIITLYAIQFVREAKAGENTLIPESNNGGDEWSG